MDNKDFKKHIDKLEKNVLAIDFDGVIHSNEYGFHDGTIYGDLIPGSKDALISLSKQYTLIIHSSKANPMRPLVNGKTGTQLIWEWLKSHNLHSYIEDVTYNKINAAFYIDDKAIRFKNWDQTLKKIYDF